MVTFRVIVWGGGGGGSDTCRQLKLVKPSNFVKNKANDTQVNLRTQITIEKNWEEMIKILFLIMFHLFALNIHYIIMLQWLAFRLASLCPSSTDP